MKQQFSKIITHVLTAVTLSLTSQAGAQAAVHTLDLDFVDRVSGPNDPFTMTLTMSPADTDIIAMAIYIAYDNTKVSLDDVEDNTGQPSSFVDYSLGAKKPLTGIPNVNEFRSLHMYTAMDLIEPVNLALLHFTSTATYNDPDSRVWIYMDGYSNRPGQANGLFDYTSAAIPTAYNNLGTPVPVTLSGFSLE